MQENNIQVSTAETLSDAFYYLKTIPNLVITGACTQLLELPQKMLSVRGLKELSEITRKENYIEAGAAVTLSKLALQGKSKMPAFLSEALLGIATPQIRNIATIGGNICANPIKGTLYAPLLALEARLILQNENENIIMPITKFSGTEGKYIVTKIRIPTDEWDIAEFRRIGTRQRLTDKSASYVFLATVENDVLTRIRIAFSGLIAFRFTNLENRITGSKLPLEEKNISSFITDASLEYDRYFADSTYSPLIKEEFLRLITYSFKKLN